MPSNGNQRSGFANSISQQSDEPRPRGGHSKCVSNFSASAVDEVTEHSRTVFVAMPFDIAFDDVYHIAIRAATEKVGCTPIRVDQLMHGQDAVMETYRRIRQCEAVIADISTAEPDVMYELGYAHALGKPIVQLCSTTPNDLPFMVRNRDTIFYRPGQTYLLIDVLADYVARLLNISS